MAHSSRSVQDELALLSEAWEAKVFAKAGSSFHLPSYRCLGDILDPMLGCESRTSMVVHSHGSLEVAKCPRCEFFPLR